MFGNIMGVIWSIGIILVTGLITIILLYQMDKIGRWIKDIFYFILIRYFGREIKIVLKPVNFLEYEMCWKEFKNPKLIKKILDRRYKKLKKKDPNFPKVNIIIERNKNGQNN